MDKNRLLLVLSAVLGGLIVAGLGWALGRTIGQSGSNPFGDLIGPLVGIWLGYPLGVALGAGFMARRLGQPPSFWWTLLFALAGAWGVLLLAEPLKLNHAPGLLWGLFFILPLVKVAVR